MDSFQIETKSRQLERRADQLIDKAVPIDKLGEVLKKATELFVYIYGSNNLVPGKLKRRIERVIKILESAFNGGNDIEDWLIRNDKVMITRAKIQKLDL